jgi:hypothetical protein
MSPLIRLDGRRPIEPRGLGVVHGALAMMHIPIGWRYSYFSIVGPLRAYFEVKQYRPANRRQQHQTKRIRGALVTAVRVLCEGFNTPQFFFRKGGRSLARSINAEGQVWI